VDKYGILTRDVTRDECPWLPYDLVKGSKVKDFYGCTYGCVSYSGTPVNIDDTEVFYEIPINSVKF